MYLFLLGNSLLGAAATPKNLGAVAKVVEANPKKTAKAHKIRSLKTKKAKVLPPEELFYDTSYKSYMKSTLGLSVIFVSGCLATAAFLYRDNLWEMVKPYWLSYKFKGGNVPDYVLQNPSESFLTLAFEVGNVEAFKQVYDALKRQNSQSVKDATAKIQDNMDNNAFKQTLAELRLVPFDEKTRFKEFFDVWQKAFIDGKATDKQLAMLTYFLQGSTQLAIAQDYLTIILKDSVYHNIQINTAIIEAIMKMFGESKNKVNIFKYAVTSMDGKYSYYTDVADVMKVTLVDKFSTLAEQEQKDLIITFYNVFCNTALRQGNKFAYMNAFGDMMVNFKKTSQTEAAKLRDEFIADQTALLNGTKLIWQAHAFLLLKIKDKIFCADSIEALKKSYTAGNFAEEDFAGFLAGNDGSIGIVSSYSQTIQNTVMNAFKLGSMEDAIDAFIRS